MVGLVLVSHSRKLASALVDFLGQVAPAQLPIAIAAGVGEERSDFGTDAIEIMEAIQTVYSEDGVLVLMDLGSAVLSAGMALELLPPEMRNKIRFCPAPLVEGAIAAAVQIGLGSDLDTICQEANTALEPKRQHMAQEAPAPAVIPSEAIAPTESITLTLKNLHGLHARPAAQFVRTAAQFKAEISVRNLTTGKGPVSARSLNALATLGAIEQHEIQISASGPEAAQALSALKTLVEANFGEAPAGEPPSPLNFPAETSAGRTGGIPVSEGVALAPLFRYEPALPPIPETPAQRPETEWKRLQEAIQHTAQAIEQRTRRLEQTIGKHQAAIFEAHLLILQDPGLSENARKRIFEQRENAAFAWNQAIQQAAQEYRHLPDAYLQARATDVEDVGRQVLFALTDARVAPSLPFETPVILYAPDLTPTETAQIDLKQVLGLITSGGGPTSHSAILARALGIPAIAGIGPLLENTPQGTLIGLDGSTGEVWIDPPASTLADLQTRRAEWLERRSRLQQYSQALAFTRDHHRIEIFANIGKGQDAQAAVENGAEGCGLLRTEFLFLTRQTAPGEEEQYQLLRPIYETMGTNRPITVRTLDVGGDKALPYLPMPQETNPFLGVRALRLSLAQPSLFLTQLRAILRAAAGFPCRIMFPMVADINEVRQAQDLLTQAHTELESGNIPHAWPVETGIMVEIPSAALLAHKLAQEVDFFSIGTNDLTQYTFAAERGNPALSHLADGLHPALLRLIDSTVQAAHAEDRWVGVCGEMAGDPEAVPVLIGLGVDELSLNPGGIPKIKALVRTLALYETQQLAQRALVECATAEEVRQLAREFLSHHQSAV
ncbi:MAG: phosphoenolpyruvate--protein phosphotransferase [Anaerolineales bacterium]|nr:phosphoenolpyruvate--protein phosphotransferase [Anaerolineales bacterium]